MFTPNELVFTFGGLYVCASFDENPSRNASVRDARRRTHRQRQTGFVICSMLYAIAVGQIIKETTGCTSRISHSGVTGPKVYSYGTDKNGF